jgi:hypothetical protein
MEVLLEAMFSVGALLGKHPRKPDSPKAAGEQITQDEEFKEFRRRKRRNTEEEIQTSKKPAVQAKTYAALNTPRKEVVTQNFFVPLRATEMDTDTSGTAAMPHEEAVAGKTGRPPPVVLTSQLTRFSCKSNFEFPSTRNATRAIT